MRTYKKTSQTYFNPHHPRGWRQKIAKVVFATPTEFQSTPPSRVATLVWREGKEGYTNFNPHHPRGWRPSPKFQPAFDKPFQSTPPSRVATISDICSTYNVNISIHTTLAGGDYPLWTGNTSSIIISIHTTLAGGDQQEFADRIGVKHFNPHHPRGWRPFFLN